MRVSVHNKCGTVCLSRTAKIISHPDRGDDLNQREWYDMTAAVDTVCILNFFGSSLMVFEMLSIRRRLFIYLFCA